MLAISDHAAFLFSSKALTVYSAPPRPSARRAATIAGHVKEAITQLRGAFRAIDGGHVVFVQGTWEAISVARSVPPLRHGVVLLAEMYSFVDWKAVATELVEASGNEKHRAFFQVLDLAELGYLVERGREGVDLNGFLINRWRTMAEKGTAYFRTRTPDPE